MLALPGSSFDLAHAPDELEAQRLLTFVAPWLPLAEPPYDARAESHLALAEAHRLLGENEVAAANYKAALTSDPNSCASSCRSVDARKRIKMIRSV